MTRAFTVSSSSLVTESPPRSERAASPRRRLARRPPVEVRTRPSWLRWWILALVLVGIAGRVAVYLLPFGVPDADEAVGGLMALAVVNGHNPGAFFWGQAYGGPLETWLAAPILAIFGPTWLGLRMVPIVLSGVSSLLVWRVGLRTIGRNGAIAAAAVSWFFPTTLLWKSVHFHIFYSSGMVLGMLVVLQVLRMRERTSARGMLLLGLVAGIGLWQSFQLVTIVPTAIAWLVVRHRASLRLIPLTVAAALLGSLPVLLSNLEHDWWSRRIAHPADDTAPYLERLWRFFTTGLPLALDLRVPITLDWFAFTAAGLLLYGVALAGYGWLWWRSRRAADGEPLELLLVIVAIFPFLYALSPLTTFVGHGGYLVVLMPVLALLLCAWVRTELHVVMVSTVALVLTVTAFTNLTVAYARPHEAGAFKSLSVFPLPRDFGPLIARLDALGIRRAYASYWIANRITFETGGRIVVTDLRPQALRTRADGVVIPLPDDPDLHSRTQSFQPIVARVKAPAFVLAKSFDVPSTDYGSLEAGHYRTSRVGMFTIFYRGALSRGVGGPAPIPPG